MNLQSTQKIFPGPLTKTFLQLCQSLREFLKEQVQRQMSGLPLAESLERTPDGELCSRKQLPVGIIFLATPNPEDPTTVTLRIFFDPPRFKEWKEAMGPMELVYMDPYGVELVLDRKLQRWGIFLDRQELHMDPEADEIYEIARFEIRESDVLRTA